MKCEVEQVLRVDPLFARVYKLADPDVSYYY
jgi:hypothetical protein